MAGQSSWSGGEPPKSVRCMPPLGRLLFQKKTEEKEAQGSSDDSLECACETELEVSSPAIAEPAAEGEVLADESQDASQDAGEVPVDQRLKGVDAGRELLRAALSGSFLENLLDEGRAQADRECDLLREEPRTPRTLSSCGRTRSCSSSRTATPPPRARSPIVVLAMTPPGSPRRAVTSSASPKWTPTSSASTCTGHSSPRLVAGQSSPLVNGKPSPIVSNLQVGMPARTASQVALPAKQVAVGAWERIRASSPAARRRVSDTSSKLDLAADGRGVVAAKSRPMRYASSARGAGLWRQ